MTPMTLFRTDLPIQAGPWCGRTLAIGIALAALVAAFCVLLWPEWRQNPDLSHGFLSPVIFFLLAWESRRLGPSRWLRSGPAAMAAQVALALAATSLFALAGLFAASIGWSHSVVLFLLALCFACLLLAGLGLLADEHVRVLPFNWVSLTAIFLWILVAPIPTGTYYRLTFALQGWVTSGVMNVLQFIGVPARQHGNVIELAHTTVGIAEACSGVRSLISCVYAGFFFAAWQVRRPRRRLLLIALAPLLAIGMNFIRSLTLTLLANAGVDIGGAWHDATGLGILGLTAVILAGLAILLETKGKPAALPAAGGLMHPPRAGGYGAFWSGLLLTATLGVFFFVNSHPTATTVTTPPALETLLPAQAAGWEVRTPDDLYQFSDVLQTTHLLQRTYLRPDGRGGVVDVTVYVAYWPAGQTSVSRVASHTPDACWPGSGWTADTKDSQHRQSPALPGLPLAPAEYRLFQNEQGFVQHVWFWHVFDGRVIDYRDPYSLSALLQIALKYGFRRQGSQYFIRVSSNRPWVELTGDPLVREIMSNLKATGL
ncbi:MAG: exosortase/archaeosortase family protein [Lacunisphaera sp.]